jgi:hypothetical protein
MQLTRRDRLVDYTSIAKSPTTPQSFFRVALKGTRTRTAQIEVRHIPGQQSRSREALSGRAEEHESRLFTATLAPTRRKTDNDGTEWPTRSHLAGFTHAAQSDWSCILPVAYGRPNLKLGGHARVLPVRTHSGGPPIISSSKRTRGHFAPPRCNKKRGTRWDGPRADSVTELSLSAQLFGRRAGLATSSRRTSIRFRVAAVPRQQRHWTTRQQPSPATASSCKDAQSCPSCSLARVQPSDRRA